MEYYTQCNGCVTQQATYAADQVSSMSFLHEKKGDDVERGGGGMGEDEASPQIYVVAVQFVILSGFSLSGKSRW